MGAMPRSERLGSLPFPDLSASAVSRAQHPILKRDCQGIFLRDGGATGIIGGRSRFAAGGNAGMAIAAEAALRPIAGGNFDVPIRFPDRGGHQITERLCSAAIAMRIRIARARHTGANPARKLILLSFVLTICALAACPAPALEGMIGIHDPSTVILCDGNYYVFGTGRGIPILTSSN